MNRILKALWSMREENGEVLVVSKVDNIKMRFHFPLLSTIPFFSDLSTKEKPNQLIFFQQTPIHFTHLSSGAFTEMMELIYVGKENRKQILHTHELVEQHGIPFYFHQDKDSHFESKLGKSLFSFFSSLFPTLVETPSKGATLDVPPERKEESAETLLGEMIEKTGAKRSELEQVEREGQFLFNEILSSGDASLQAELGRAYHFGEGVEANYERAAKLYEKSVEGDKTGRECTSLAELFMEGKGVPQDARRALHLLWRASDFGYSRAELLLGKLYEFGKYVKQDLLSAAKHYLRAHESGEKEASWRMGMMLESGRRVGRNLESAAFFLKQSLPLSSLNLALLYETRNTVQDVQKAFEIYKSHFEEEEKRGKKDSFAAFKLGFFYENGIHVEQDFVVAADYYKKSEENVFSAFRLALFYESGLGVKRDLKRAASLFHFSAFNESGLLSVLGVVPESEITPEDIREEVQRMEEKRKKKCLWRLAIILLNGNGVEKNVEKAVEMLQQSLPFSRVDLALLFEEGVHIQRNYSSAFQLMKRASEEGDPVATFKLACMLEEEKFGQQNLEKSRQLLVRASKMPNCDSLLYLDPKPSISISREVNRNTVVFNNASTLANIKLGEIYEKAIGVERDEEMALQFYMKAAYEGSHPFAFFLLGKMWEKKDARKSVALYERAAHGGCEEAFFALSKLYEEGTVKVKKDVQSSFQIMRIAANEGVAGAFEEIERLEQTINQPESLPIE